MKLKAKKNGLSLYDNSCLRHLIHIHLTIIQYNITNYGIFWVVTYFCWCMFINTQTWDMSLLCKGFYNSNGSLA